MNLPAVSHPAEALILAKIMPHVLERARQVRLMAFDVDGVLTDGRLWYGDNGETIKCFNALDGYGLKLLQENGIAVALISGREASIVSRRAADLGIATVLQGVRDKVHAVAALAHDNGYAMDQIGYMGDDIIDMAALRRVGFAASVPTAPAYVAQAAHWVSQKEGGSGAVRECCDLILAAQGRLGACFGSIDLTRDGSSG